MPQPMLRYRQMFALGYNSWFLDHDLSMYPMDNIIRQSPREIQGKDYKATMLDFNNQSGKLIQSKPLPNGSLGISAGNRFAKNRAGFIVAANVQSYNKGYSSTFLEDEMIQTERTVRLTERKNRQYSENLLQYGLHAKADFRLSPKHKIDWYNAFIGSKNRQVRETTSLSFKLNYNPANGYEDLSYQTRLRTQLQTIFTSNLQGKHMLSDNFTIDWSGVYSIANNRMPELTQINLDNLRQDFIDNIYVDADGSTRRWEYNFDRDYNVFLNTRYQNSFGKWKLIAKSRRYVSRQKTRKSLCKLQV
jgi:hypothetical protein